MSEIIPISLIVVTIAFFSDLFSRKDPLGNKYIYKEKLLWIAVFIAMGIFFGLRKRYNDTSTYVESYIYLTNSTFDYSDINWAFGANPGFKLVNITLKSLGFTQWGFLMFYSLITYTIYIWFIHKYSTDFTMSIFLFVCMVMTFPAAAIKQCVSVAFCLLAVDKAINKRWFWFMFWILIAMFFHNYAFVYLAVPLLMYIPWVYGDKRAYYTVILFMLGGFMLKPMLGTIIDVTNMLGDEYTAESFNGEGVNPFRVIVCLVPLIMSYILRKKIDDPQYEIQEHEGLFMNLSMLNGEIMFVALFGTANYFGRLANYFNIFPLIVLPRLFNLVSPKWRVPMKIAAIASYIFFFWYSNIYSATMPFNDLFDRFKLSEFQMFTAE